MLTCWSSRLRGAVDMSEAILWCGATGASSYNPTAFAGKELDPRLEPPLRGGT